jgi:hypothetical protein
MFTRMYPGNWRCVVGTFLPFLISMTFSVGILISPKYLPTPSDSIRRSSVVRTLFS